MKTVDEIIEYIDNADEWNADKEWGLIVRMGGGSIKDGHFYVNPNNYKLVDSRIRQAKRKLAKRDSDTSWEDFQKEVSQMFA